ncbi:hypothetical protein FHS43_006142 [Streptosporangium becharense]|uniref:Uncharacterized protein n=1 Tax=Streptosporangium becharense TaxID=1816182 RepID=A0A7W9IHW7_9ACTN|nr:hypothetical protein [Streptosporangium becharense]MBB2914830.1 hypothetical protein [Streptosporangium becharense]MBB5820359.1 hypothetical protein [Streptosporangium becharense]
MVSVLAMSSNQTPAGAAVQRNKALGSISQSHAVGTVTGELLSRDRDRDRPGARPSRRSQRNFFRWGSAQWEAPARRHHRGDGQEQEQEQEQGRDRGWRSDHVAMNSHGASGRRGPGRHQRLDRSARSDRSDRFDRSGRPDGPRWAGEPITVDRPDGSQRIIRDLIF